MSGLWVAIRVWDLDDSPEFDAELFTDLDAAVAFMERQGYRRMDEGCDDRWYRCDWEHDDDPDCPEAKGRIERRDCQ